MSNAWLLPLLCLGAATCWADSLDPPQQAGYFQTASASLRRTDAGCTDGDLPGMLNARGENCSFYIDGLPKMVCDLYNTPTFNASDLCCFCKERPEKPDIPANCKDTNHFKADALGRTCDFFNTDTYGHELCGFSNVTKDFNATDMCCGCRTEDHSGGYEGGPLCHYSAVNVVPDGNNLCHCSATQACFQLGFLSDCPAQGARSSTSFDINCTTCQCMSFGHVTNFPYRSADCGLHWNHTGLPDTTPARTFVQIMNAVLATILGYGDALRSIRRQWLKHARYIDLVNIVAVRSDRRLLREWANILFQVHDEARYELGTCEIIFPDSGIISLQNSGCGFRGEGLSFRSSVNPSQYLEEHVVKGRSCDSSDYGFTECQPNSLWLESWSVRHTEVLSNRSGNWSLAMQPYHTEDEGWYRVFMKNPQGRFHWLGVYTSHIFREPLVALGQPLMHPHLGNLVGIARCQVFATRLSSFLAGLVGAGDSHQKLFFYQMISGELLASSSGPVEDFFDYHSEPLHYKGSPDPVVRHAGDVISSLEGQMLYEYENNYTRHILYWRSFSDIAWPAKNMTIELFVSSMAVPFWIVYVMPARCLPGMYSVNSSATAVHPCQACPVGRKSEWGMVIDQQCEECAPGSYAGGPGSTICFTCETGFYQDEHGATACKECPENTRSNPGAKVMRECMCKEGYYNYSEALRLGSHEVKGTLGCSACPEGSSCEGGEKLPRAKSKYFLLAPTVSVRCVSTMTGNPCLGGSEDASALAVRPPEPYSHVITNYCQAGFEGISCTYCAPGYFRFGRDCLECTGVNESFLRFMWVLLLVVFYMLRRVVNSKYKTLYIFLSFLQVFGLQGSFPLDWSSKIKQTMRIIQVANLQVDLLVPYCRGERDVPFFFKYVGYLLLPWFFLLVDLTVIFVARVIKSCRGTARRISRLHNQHRDTPVPSAQPPAEEMDAEARNSAGSAATGVAELACNLTKGAGKLAQLSGIDKRSHSELVKDFLAQSLVNMRLMYLSLCGRTLDMLQCTELGSPLHGSRLSKDMNYVCWEGRHLSFMPLVALATAVYLIGTPVCYIVVLYRGYRSNLLYSAEHLRRYGLLYGRFEHDYFFWELCIILRRVTAVAIRTLLNIRTAEQMANGYIGNYQASLVASVMVVALAIHFWTRPFCNSFLDLGEACYLGGTFFSCLIGISFSTARTDDERNAFEFLFFLNLMLILFVTAFLLWVDVEMVHPRVRKLRQRVTDRLWVGGYAKNRIKSVVQKTHQAEYMELIPGLNYEEMADSAVVHNTMKAFVSFSILDHLSTLDIHIPEELINSYICRAEDDSDTLVRTTIKPPKGIRTEKIQEALDEASKNCLIRNLLPSLSCLRVMNGGVPGEEGAGKIQRV